MTSQVLRILIVVVALWFSAELSNAQNRVQVGSDTSLVGFGSVVIHSQRYRTFHVLGGYTPGTMPSKAPNSFLRWRSKSTLVGPGRDQFDIWFDGPTVFMPTKSLWVNGGRKYEIDAYCKPTRKGRHVAYFSPEVFRGEIDKKAFPISLICTGIGKTPNRNGIFVTTGYQNNPLEFPKIPLRTKETKRVLISNFSEKTVEIKVDWQPNSPWLEVKGVKVTPFGFWGLKFLNPIKRKLSPGENMYVKIGFEPRVSGVYKGVLEVTVDGEDWRYLYIEGKG